MAAPKISITRYDLAMSYQEYSFLAASQGFVGLQVLPAIGVDKKAATYPVIPIEAIKAPITDDKRAPRSGYKRDDFEWDEDSYATDEHGREADVDDAEIEMYGDILEVEQIARNRAVLQTLESYEANVASAVFNTGTWTGAALTTALAKDWTDPTATPVTDVFAAMDKVEDNCFYTPNAAIIQKRTLRAFVQSPQVKDFWKNLAGNDAQMPAHAELFKLIFGLDKVISPGSLKNTANLGLDAVIDRIWNKRMVMICRISDNRDVSGMDPRIGNTFMWDEQNISIPGLSDTQMAMIIEEYREEKRRGGVIRNRCNYGLKIMQKQCGHLLTNVMPA